MENTLKSVKTSSQHLHSTFHRLPKNRQIFIYTHHTEAYDIPSSFYTKIFCESCSEARAFQS